jgi:hypothetical protein
VIAALFVQRGGVYWDLPGVDPGDGARDARKYAGPWPVVAHPPCSRWCQLAFINQKRYGHRVGDDGGAFAAAFAAVNRWGGVLEHPARSYAWSHFGLPRPVRGEWRTSIFQPGWVTEVSQGAYGHRARKLTWLYVVASESPTVDWSVPAPKAQVSFCKNHGNSPLPRLSKREASATPIPFRDLLLSIARTARPSEARHAG